MRQIVTTPSVHNLDTSQRSVEFIKKVPTVYRIAGATLMLRILLADDHAVIRRAFRLILEAEPGWTVCAEASSGDEAVSLAVLHRPHIVILDVVMPGLSGFEAARQIGLTCTDCAIVIVTMHKSAEVLHVARAAGAQSLLNKSDADEHLVPAVRALCQGESYFLSDSDRGSRVS